MRMKITSKRYFHHKWRRFVNRQTSVQAKCVDVTNQVTDATRRVARPTMSPWQSPLYSVILGLVLRISLSLRGDLSLWQSHQVLSLLLLRVRFPFLYKKTHLFRCFFFLEQATGIEPALKAWEALILPLNYACTALLLYHMSISKIKCFL